MTRQRHATLTVGTGLIAAMTTIFIFGAPPVPVAIGVLVTVAWLLWRGPVL
jgi:hypothetical protein